MLKESDIVKMIFGLKVQFLRREQELSYQQLSERTGLAISYLHSIEKGRKYPKADKILILARALSTDYDYLVSLDADKRLQPIVHLLQSDFLKIFPLEMFGISVPKLLELLLQAPDRVNAFISTVLKITRNFNLQGEDFYKAALRSYQDLHNNYFPDLERAVHEFRERNDLSGRQQLREDQLEKLLLYNYGVRVDRDYLPTREQLSEIRSYYVPEQKLLFINPGLQSSQRLYLLAKELAYQELRLEDRALETHMLEVDSFEKLLANFKTSYFAVALLLDEALLVGEVEAMSQWKEWREDEFLQLLHRYQVTPEMLLQRLANLLPRHFGIHNLFFLRFFAGPDLGRYEMTKEMHLSQLHNPHANQLNEHYCRRWISINLIRRLKAMQGVEDTRGPIAGVQISRYWGTDNQYLCICLAKAASDDPRNSASVTIGLLVTERLRQLFPWIGHPSMTIKDVHTTCERCSILDCGARASAPVVVQRRRAREEVKRQLASISGLPGAVRTTS